MHVNPSTAAQLVAQGGAYWYNNDWSKLTVTDRYGGNSVTYYKTIWFLFIKVILQIP